MMGTNILIDLQYKPSDIIFGPCVSLNWSWASWCEFGKELIFALGEFWGCLRESLAWPSCSCIFSLVKPSKFSSCSHLNPQTWMASIGLETLEKCPLLHYQSLCCLQFPLAKSLPHQDQHYFDPNKMQDCLGAQEHFQIHWTNEMISRVVKLDDLW